MNKIILARASKQALLRSRGDDLKISGSPPKLGLTELENELDINRSDWPAQLSSLADHIGAEKIRRSTRRS